MLRLLVLACLIMPFSVKAQDRFEVGIGAGYTHAIGGEAFKNAAKNGDGQLFWLGYGLDKNWGVELGLDQMDFDGVRSRHQGISLDAVYRMLPENKLHPIAKLGLASVESKSALDAKTTAFGAKAALGLEYDCKYVSVGALLDYLYMSKTDDAADLKNTQALMPAVFLTIHNALDASDEDTSKSVAPAAAPLKKDSDNDGVADEDDKCPNTPAGVAVNKIGCSEKEKASVKLNVTFASGKTQLDSSSDAEVQNLAAFMKKFPDTNVEIAGHTDNAGADKVNKNLSQKRAEAVKAALEKAGVESSRLTAKGYGSSKPIASNSTKVGRDENRRVNAEIVVSVDKKK